jgi:uncharacterized protein YneF (UPF0154 family)
LKLVSLKPWKPSKIIQLKTRKNPRINEDFLLLNLF